MFLRRSFPIQTVRRPSAPNKFEAQTLAGAFGPQLEQLIVRNAENLRWAFFRGFDETFRNAIGRLDERLDDAVETTRRVIEKTLAERRDKSFCFEREISRLSGTLGSLAELRQALTDRGSIREARPHAGSA
jgi:hypothetical protein